MTHDDVVDEYGTFVLPETAAEKPLPSITSSKVLGFSRRQAVGTLATLCLTLGVFALRLSNDPVTEGIYSGTASKLVEEGGGSFIEPSHAIPDIAETDTIETVESQAPNILVLLADDMGWNDVGYNSNDLQGLSPNIDMLASQGVKLQQYYSQHLCTPARAALLTGKYPIRLGLQHEEVIEPTSPFGLPLKEKLLPEYLSEAGYKTYMLGKWHLGHHMEEMLPMRRGFDNFFGFLGDQETYMNHEYPHQLNNEYYYDLMVGNNETYSLATEHKGVFSPQVYSEAANNILTVHDEQFKMFPFFFYYAFQNVHAPLLDDDLPSLNNFTLIEQEKLTSIKYKARRKFAKLVLTLDHNVGSLYETLESRGMWDNTVMIFASDNGACNLGGGYNTPLKGGKHFLFEGGLRVPAFVSSPLLPADSTGNTYSGLMHVSDWLPTIMHLARIETPSDIDGVNQWHAIAAASTGVNKKSPRSEILHNVDYWRYPSVDSLQKMSNPRAAIRSSDMKLIVHHWDMPKYVCPADTLDDGIDGLDDCAEPPGDDLENFLFNITADPTEEVNLFSVYHEIAETLRERLDVIYNTTAMHPVWAATDSEAYKVWDEAGGIVPWHTTTS